jgi:HEPN pEK499 p136
VAWVKHAISQLEQGNRANVRTGPADHPRCFTLLPVEPASVQVGDVLLVRVNNSYDLYTVLVVNGYELRITDKKGKMIDLWVPISEIKGKLLSEPRENYEATRNDALGFAIRTKKNLHYIASAFEQNADVHVVTQLVNSLLGLVVFPWERRLVEHLRSMRLDHLATKGWPTWNSTLGTCDTLGQMIRYIRNGIAHGNICFSSDNRKIEDVFIEIWNKPQPPEPPWVGQIRADRLQKFCLMFATQMENSLN